ncbi:unnamed protein product [Spirodela intermedia]|uniref:Uncharacterized protein n=2 Tax=Spirodela intermedia TaxID=51605 RepID=A0A7I8JDJ3_SPIIN|nr:unnamed protein product [Spirodela intermedia]CAA6668230.1 unnamed protein product [Spirodela intermedia]CAA7405060.1 unnamed protein product [Spirodela intermedia]
MGPSFPIISLKVYSSGSISNRSAPLQITSWILDGLR